MAHEDCPPDEIRSSAEVANRALALFAAVGVAIGAPRDDVLHWLAENSLADYLSPREAIYLGSTEPNRPTSINFSWQSERLIVLLWALNLAELPPPYKQCNAALFQSLLPPYTDVEVGAFIDAATLRPNGQLLEMADDLLNLHWIARDSELNDRPPEKPVDIEIIQERHHAINWIIGYDGLPWDDVTTDT